MGNENRKKKPITNLRQLARIISNKLDLPVTEIIDEPIQRKRAKSGNKARYGTGVELSTVMGSQGFIGVVGITSTKKQEDPNDTATFLTTYFVLRESGTGKVQWTRILLFDDQDPKQPAGHVYPAGSITGSFNECYHFLRRRMERKSFQETVTLSLSQAFYVAWFSTHANPEFSSDRTSV